jgi:exopolysaccharide biosynthesis protein
MIKALLLLLLCLSVVKHTSTATVIVVNPSYYRAETYSGTTSAPIAFNTNYYDPSTRQAINVLMDHGKYQPYLWDPTANTRPCLYITKDGRAHIGFRPWKTHRAELDIIVQGGPTLLGPKDPHENLAPDTMRITDQVSVGLDPAGLLYVAFTHNMSMHSISQLFRRLGCTQAIKLDGGHSAHLQYDGIHLGNPHVICGLAWIPK